MTILDRPNWKFGGASKPKVFNEIGLLPLSINNIVPLSK
jgi:hypothetical protein